MGWPGASWTASLASARSSPRRTPRRPCAIGGGRKRLTDVFFEDDDELLPLVRRAVGRLGRRLDETSPMVDARLPDGSRLNAVIPPLTSRWTHVTIRQFLLRARTLEDLVALGTLTTA